MTKKQIKQKEVKSKKYNRIKKLEKEITYLLNEIKYENDNNIYLIEEMIVDREEELKGLNNE